MSKRALLIALLLTTLGSGGVFGDTISTWNGGTGNWGTGSNWTPPAVPNNSGSSAYDVTIASGGTDIVNLDPGLNPTINSLILGGTTGSSSLRDVTPSPGDVLTVTNNMAVNATGQLGFIGNKAFNVNGTLTNSGSIFFEVASLSAGNFVNSGDLNLQAAAPAIPTAFSVSGKFTNDGIAQLGLGLNAPYAPVTTLGQFTNNGNFSLTGNPLTLTNQPDGITDVPKGSTVDLTAARMLAGSNSAFAKLTSVEGRLSFYVSPATITDTPQSSTLTVAPSGQLFFTDGMNWTLAGNLSNLGSISLGEDMRQQGPDVLRVLGTMTNGGNMNVSGFMGNMDELSLGTGTPKRGYTQFADGVLDELISDGSSYGTINVDGPVSLSGTLDIMLQNGFLPAPGESFKILTFAPGELSGSFDRILGDPNFTIDYNEAGGYVSITAEPVPEPGTLLLTGFALFGFGAYAVCRFVKRCEPVVE